MRELTNNVYKTLKNFYSATDIELMEYLYNTFKDSYYDMISEGKDFTSMKLNEFISLGIKMTFDRGGLSFKLRKGEDINTLIDTGKVTEVYRNQGVLVVRDNRRRFRRLHCTAI